MPMTPINEMIAPPRSQMDAITEVHPLKGCRKEYPINNEIGRIAARKERNSNSDVEDCLQRCVAE